MESESYTMVFPYESETKTTYWSMIRGRLRKKRNKGKRMREGYEMGIIEQEFSISEINCLYERRMMK
jgi:hypothetical protein